MAGRRRGRGGRRGRGRGRGGRGRRLVDPGEEIDVDELVDYLRKKHRVARNELRTYKEVPRHFRNEVPAVRALNKGASTIYGRIAHLRRRLLKLMLSDDEDLPEGLFIQERLVVFAKEAVIIHEQIEKLNGQYYPFPAVLLTPVTLRY